MSMIRILTSLLGIVLCIFLLQNCKKTNTISWDDSFYQKIAWNALSKQEKGSITGGITSGKVERTHYNKTNQEAISVTFNTVDDALLGPIIVYIDPNTLKVIGFAARF